MNSDLLSPVKDLNATQARVRQTLDKGVQIDLSTESCNRFLKRKVNQKVGVVILYVDIEGSTKMSMTLSPEKFATILHVFSQEMSLVTSEYGGYVLKYVGDAIIALFPAEYDKAQASKNALECSKDMQKIIKECVNPELSVRRFPEITVKMSIDYGDVQVVLYGKSMDRSHIDIVGSSISMAAKMIPLAKTGQIIIGQSMYENLEKNQNLKEMNVDRTKWTYTDEKTGKSYKLYILG
ncbi:MAG TPA: adenylate/guanylate cyclase domain-containing protein [Nitrososphaera sp.]|jgi:adenylate cyclase|nr:adenylate/guanylate cyclase domain-containing protein [Nitrososphaera sp.]